MRFQNVLRDGDDLVESLRSFFLRRCAPFVLRTDVGIHADPRHDVIKMLLEQLRCYEVHAMLVALGKLKLARFPHGHLIGILYIKRYGLI